MPFVASLAAVLVLSACSGGTQEAGIANEAVSLGQLVSRARGAEYYVTYDEHPVDGSQGELVVAVKGDKTYVSFDFEGGEPFEGGLLVGTTNFSGVEIEDGSISYSCGGIADLFGLFGESDSGEVCYKSEAIQESDLPSLRDLFNPAAWGMALASAQAEADGSESIAGRNASCFRVDASDIGRGRACVDQDLGVLLLFEGTDPECASFSARATELRDEVDDSIFEPPYEVKEYPELPFSE